MATGGQRDDAALREGLSRWVAAHPELVPGGRAEGGDGNADGPPPQIVSLDHAGGGLANETVLVDLGPARPGMVVRLPPLEPTFPDYDLGPQATVQNAVAAAGVPAPAPAVVEHDPDWIGAPFLVMPRVSGDIAGPAPVFDPYVMDAGPDLQRRMHDGLFDTLAAIHAVPWEVAGLGGALPELSVRGASRAGRPTWTGRRRAIRSPRWPTALNGAPATCRESAPRSCCGATCGWAISSSTRRAG